MGSLNPEFALYESNNYCAGNYTFFLLLSEVSKVAVSLAILYMPMLLICMSVYDVCFTHILSYLQCISNVSMDKK